MKNPYLELINIIQTSNSAKDLMFLATVTKEYPNLSISFNDIELDREDFLIDYNLANYNELNPLKVGDKVLVIQVREKFIVTNRVV